MANAPRVSSTRRNRRCFAVSSAADRSASAGFRGADRLLEQQVRQRQSRGILEDQQNLAVETPAQLHGDGRDERIARPEEFRGIGQFHIIDRAARPCGRVGPARSRRLRSPFGGASKIVVNNLRAASSVALTARHSSNSGAVRRRRSVRPVGPPCRSGYPLENQGNPAVAENARPR